MSTHQDFVEHVCEQSELGSRVSYKKMFGEYALYVDAKVVALVCDNQLFVKPTDEGRQLLGRVCEAPPYPGAKPHFLVNEILDDCELLKELLNRTACAMPAPKPKTARATKSRKA